MHEAFAVDPSTLSTTRVRTLHASPSSDVYVTTTSGDGAHVVVKRTKITGPNDMKRFDKELELLLACRHKHLVPVLGVLRAPPTYALLLPLYERGSLFGGGLSGLLSRARRLLLGREEIGASGASAGVEEGVTVGAVGPVGLGLLLLGFQSIFGGDNPVLLYFGVLTIFFQRAPDLPAANDLDGVDTKRKAVAAAAALFVVLMLIPCAEITSTAGLLDSIAPLLENVDTV